MPSEVEHTTAGGLIGLMCYLGYKNLTNSKPSFLGAIGSTLLGSFAGTLPDTIEPAVNPQHRGLFHSASLGISLTYVLRNIAKSEKLGREEKLISAILGLGYLSHLSMDSQTKQGLPLF